MTVRFGPTKTQKIVQPIACGLLGSAVVAGCVKALGKSVFEAKWAGLSIAGGLGCAAVRWLTFPKGPFIAVKAKLFFPQSEKKEKIEISALVDGEKQCWKIEVPAIATPDTRKIWNRIGRSMVELSRAGVRNVKDVTFVVGTEIVDSVESKFPFDHPISQGLISIWTALLDQGDTLIERPNFARWMEQLEELRKEGVNVEFLYHMIFTVVGSRIFAEQEEADEPKEIKYGVAIRGGGKDEIQVTPLQPLESLIESLDLEAGQELWYDGVNLSAFESNEWHVLAFGIDGTAPLEIRQKKS